MALTREERIKKLRDQYTYADEQLVMNDPVLGGKDRLKRRRKGLAAMKLRDAADKVRRKKREQGSKYEALSRAGEAKSAADRERHMKLVLGDDWKPSDEGYLARRKTLKNMDKRNRALDPENDQGLLSGLRNKLDIMPTAAENERRIRAKNAAKREQARLSEGEAEGALAGSAAERIRDARRAQYEMSRTPQEYDDHRIKSKKKREDDYKGFTDEAALIARERAMRGESPITDSTLGSLDDVGKDAMRHLRGKEAEAETEKRILGEGIRAQDFLTEADQQKYGVERKSQLPPSIRAELDDPERGGESLDPLGERLAGKRIHETSPHLGTSIEEKAGGYRIPFTDKMKEEQGGKSIPFTEEMAERTGGKSLDLNDKDNRELLRGIDPEKAATLDMGDTELDVAKDDEARRLQRQNESGIEGIGSQEEAQQAIRDASPEDQKAISEEIAKVKGKGSPEWVESKEATGNYVEYEGSGLVINMAALDKDIQRNRNMEMLKHIPAANRPAMLVEWGYIDPGDLSIAQKKSAKELKELSLLDLKIAETQGRIEKNKNSMGEKQKLQYTAANKGMQQALKDKDYALAEVYRNELNTIMPTGDTSNFQELIDKGIKTSKIKTPIKVFKAAGLKDGTKYYDSALSISKSVNFLKTSSGSTRSTKFEELLGQTAIDPVTGKNKGTYGEFLKNQGIYQWNDVKNVDPSQYDIPEWAVTSEENYMKWALPQIQNKLMLSIWGNIHQQVQQSNGIQLEKAMKEKGEAVLDPGFKKAIEEKPKTTKTKPSTKVEKQTTTEEADGTREKTSVEKIHTGSKSRKMHQYDNFIKRANDAEKYLTENRDALTEKEIKKLETEIKNAKNRAQEFKTAGEEADKRITKEQERAKLHKELKEYNKKREEANLGWIRIDEYKRLKEEGKIK